MAIVVEENSLFGCCASRRFAQGVARSSPYPNMQALVAEARRVWWHECGVLEWLAAFSAHPKIGEKKPEGGHTSTAFATFSHSEQSAAAQTATEAIAQELQQLNKLYADKFGFIFIICARGRSSAEILTVLKERINRLPHEELQAAAQEQMKITELRLATLTGQATVDPTEAQARMQRRADQVLKQVVATHASGPLRSPITTHVLDTALGVPAQGLPLKLLKQDPVSRTWETLSSGVTNEDGRVANLLPASNYLAPGRYQMYFNTTEYLKACKTRYPTYYAAVPFYPEVTIDFEITNEGASEHYHIPLLLSPYGYSTYRGS